MVKWTPVYAQGAAGSAVGSRESVSAVTFDGTKSASQSWCALVKTKHA